jgi:hypothetical protein
MGFESALQGRDGKTLIAGEDTELTYALKLIGAKLYYSSKMQFQHYMPKERIHWEYLKRLWASFGYSEYVISPYNNYFNKRKLPLRYVQFFKTVKAIMVLSYIIYKNNYGEGDRKVLVLEKQKGRLRAILFATKQKKIVTQTIQRLSTDK